MRVLKSRVIPFVFSGAAALAFLVTPSVLTASQDTDDSRSVAAPCYMGTTFPNPYGRSCTIPGPLHKIRGSAPDANAIIACRGIPGCLSWYVNNP